MLNTFKIVCYNLTPWVWFSQRLEGHILDKRQQQLEVWLQKICPNAPQKMIALPADASFRRYFRVHFSEHTQIAMDSPPQQESINSFLAVAKTYQDAGLCVPHIEAYDIEQGFILMSDLGDNIYLNVLNAHNAEQLYQRALRDLLVIQRIPKIQKQALLPFDKAFMARELAQFQTWFLKKHLDLTIDPGTQTLLDQCFTYLLDSASEQPQVCIHRDYHSRNLMLMDDNRVGILDFQDTMQGPLTYDLVSLLRDCYIDWPRRHVVSWALFYYQAALTAGLISPDISQRQFLKWFDWMGIQRHMKAVFIFARKWHRDNNPHYLNDIPRTLRYIYHTSSEYPEFSGLKNFMQTCIQKLPTREIA